ncbi:hypothetical protein FRC07_005165 [Ceratobasidium sp. 392]|nr:hypothetical protein FRC07_005165 [Ceratobasidium sp. 392]
MTVRPQHIVSLLFLASIALAHENESLENSGMTMPMPDTNVADAHAETNMATMMTMTPYFHWLGNADALYFKSWVPRSAGALVGACIGLFFLAIFERFLAGAKGLVEAWWRRRQAAQLARTLVTPDNVSVHSTHSHSKSVEAGSGTAFLMGAAPPLIAPFERAHDSARGAMQAVQSLIGFFLMLSVMTYNGAFLIAVVLGLGVGEVAFARLGRSGAHPGCVAARM